MIASMTTLLSATLLYLVSIFGGSLGWAIIALSLGIRIALLPVSIRIARRSLRNQVILRSLQPELTELKRRFEKSPERLFDETRKLYQKHHFSPFDLPTLLGSFLQLPIFGMLYGAIRRALTSSSAFLWIRNLSSPNAVLTLVILGLTAISAYWMPTASEHSRSLMVCIQIIVTSLIVWKLAAGLGLYWVCSSLVSLFQTVWLRQQRIGNASPA
jgi:YidC/Oxa1 family membrane protein insertase